MRRCFSLSIWLFLAMALSAQVLPVGSVDGIVKDPSGALLTGVKVTLKNVDTGITRATVSNEEGYFFFPLVPPGAYGVEAEKTGFKKGTQEISVRTGIRSTADFSLQLGQINESVQVTGQAALLETSTASVSRNIQQRVVTDMPLLARNVLMLVNLAPGITNNSPTSNTTGLIDIDSTSYTSASGANNRTNEFLMDGIPNNVSDRVAYIPSVDDVEEFTVQTNALDAEYGHGGGMFVNVTTKGGTNSYHGNLYEFFRNDKLNANAFFSNKAGSPRPVFRFNQYGLTAGGPVVKNKVFWFFNFEGLRQRTPKTYRFTAPTALQRTGDFSQTFNAAGALFQIADPLTTISNGSGGYTRMLFPGNRIPTNRINSIAANVISRYPAANLPGDAFTGANNYFTEVPAPYDGENYSTRIDPPAGRRSSHDHRTQRARPPLPRDRRRGGASRRGLRPHRLADRRPPPRRQRARTLPDRVRARGRARPPRARVRPPHPPRAGAPRPLPAGSSTSTSRDERRGSARPAPRKPLAEFHAPRPPRATSRVPFGEVDDLRRARRPDRPPAGGAGGRTVLSTGTRSRSSSRATASSVRPAALNGLRGRARPEARAAPARGSRLVGAGLRSRRRVPKTTGT